MGVAEGGALEPWRRAQQQGCRGQSGEIPAQRIGADQHSPAREACLLTRWGGRGLGAETRASEVGSQGEDWGWLREHSLKGLVHHSWPEGSPGKSLDLPKRQETIVSGARGEGIQSTTQMSSRDGHETLRLLLQPPRSLCASTGHYPHLPSREPVQPARQSRAE